MVSESRPKRPLRTSTLEHQGAVEIVEDVVEAGVDVGVDPADPDVALQRHRPEIGGDAELPRAACRRRVIGAGVRAADGWSGSMAT